MAVHHCGTLPLDHSAQGGHGPRVGDRRMEWARGVRMKGWKAAAPSADADDAYTVEYLLFRMVPDLKCHNRDRVAEADQLAAEGLHVPFEAADDGSVEIAQLKDVHQRLRSRHGLRRECCLEGADSRTPVFLPGWEIVSVPSVPLTLGSNACRKSPMVGSPWICPPSQLRDRAQRLASEANRVSATQGPTPFPQWLSHA